VAVIRANADGEILQFLQSEDEESRFPVSPQGTATTIEFDEGSNPAVVRLLNTDWNSFSVSANTLHRNGQPIVLAPDGSRRSDAKAVKALTSKLNSNNQLTGNEIKQLFRAILRILKRS
jgi:hypothetical protein